MHESNLIKEIFLLSKLQEIAGLSSLFVSKNKKKYKMTCSHRLHALISSVYMILLMCISCTIISNFSELIQIITEKSFFLIILTTLSQGSGYISCYYIYYKSFTNTKILLDIYKKLEQIEYDFTNHGITSTYNTRFILICSLALLKLFICTFAFLSHNWKIFSQVNEKYYQVTIACNLLVTYCNILFYISEIIIMYLIHSIAQKLNLIVLYMDKKLLKINSNGKYNIIGIYLL